MFGAWSSKSAAVCWCRGRAGPMSAACGAWREIWPGQVVLPPGYTIGLRIEGKDFARPRSGILGWARDFLMDDILHLNVRTGSGFFLHNHAEDRPKEIYGGKNTMHTGGDQPSYLLVPVIP